MYKKIISLCCIGFCLFLMTGCKQQKTSSSTADGDFIIFNKAEAISFSFEKDKIKKHTVVARVPDRMYPRNDYVEEVGNIVYGQTMENNKPGFPYLYRYDKTNHSIKILDDGDAYAMTYDGEFLYRTEVYTDRVVLHKYNSNFKEVSKKEIPNTTTLELTNDILAIGEKLYILVGSVDDETSAHANRLWILDKNLELLEERDIDYTSENRGGFLQMINIGQTLYIAEPSRGRREDGELGPGYNIVTYNLDTQELGQIQVEIPYPHDLYYDEERHILVVYHYTLYVEDAKWTFIDLDDNSQRTISLGKGFDQDAYFTQQDGLYYFLFNDKLVQYNYDEDKKKEYSLKEFGIDSASVLVFEK